MSKIGYKVRDKNTGMFWSGDCRWSGFNNTGKTWRKRETAESAIAYFIKYKTAFHNPIDTTTRAKQVESWEIVEIEVVENVLNTHDISEFLKFNTIRSEIEKHGYQYVWFFDTMKKRGVHNDIEFIFDLKPAEGKRNVDQERIKEARAHLRQLGVKTRTFKENNGMFGMMNREQALRARLVLDVKNVIDVGDIRNRVQKGDQI